MVYINGEWIPEGFNEPTDYQMRAKKILAEYIRKVCPTMDPSCTCLEDMPPYECYIINFSKTLQNWKALMSTTLPDGKVYELTYDGDKKRTYIDTYQKIMNVTIPD